MVITAVILPVITGYMESCKLLGKITRDKKFEYGLVLDWYGTVHIGIDSGLLSLS